MDKTQEVSEAGESSKWIAEFVTDDDVIDFHYKGRQVIKSVKQIMEALATNEESSKVQPIIKDEALNNAIELIEIYEDKLDSVFAAKVLKSCMEALAQPQCNSHPKAPHGFSRDASHSADRYVCDCEGWDAWQDGYEEGLRKGLELEQPADRFADAGKVIEPAQDSEQAPCEQPVAWIKDIGDKGIIDFAMITEEEAYPVYTHPAPSWQGLSDDEKKKIWFNLEHEIGEHIVFGGKLADAIEQALKEKNT